MGQIKGTETRKIAAYILEEVIRRSNSVDVILERISRINKNYSQLNRRDRAFCRMLATSTLRYLTQIDYALDKFLDKPLSNLPEKVKIALRLGVVQIIFLETPNYASVNMSVNLVSKNWRSLTNAILRRITREKSIFLKHLNDGPKIPIWLEKRWKKNWKEEYEEIIKIHQNLKPPIDISVKSNAKYWAKELNAKLLQNDVLRIYGEGRINKLSGFQLGEWWVQDFSSQIPVRLLNVRSGENILDLCSAPGGKTVQLATLGAKVTSVDKSVSRFQRLKSNLKRLKLTSELINEDILKYKFNKNWSKILLDAPCSSTGTLRRNPDIMYNKNEKEVLLLTSIQEKLLDKSWSILNQNGFLIYCTCSLEKEEGEDQIEKFLKKHKDARLDKILESEMDGIEESISKKGWLRILPHHYKDKGGTDGFFIARLKKVS